MARMTTYGFVEAGVEHVTERGIHVVPVCVGAVGPKETTTIRVRARVPERRVRLAQRARLRRVGQRAGSAA